MSGLTAAREFREIPIALIDEPELPSRTEMSEVLMDELVVSIRAVGLISPIFVARVGDRYRVVAGHRRRLACGRAGVAVVPCIVYPSADEALDAIQQAENRHREELSASDEAIWFSELLERKCGGDVDRLCALVGEKRGYVEGRLALFSGDERVFAALGRGDIRIGVAQRLNECGDELHRRMLLHQAIHGGATVAIVAGWIQEWKQLHGPATSVPAPSAPASASGPVPETNYFTCALCKRTDNVHLMQPVSIHTYCQQAMLHLMVEMYERRHEFHRWPRTLDEAIELVNDLGERFPQLLTPPQS